MRQMLHSQSRERAHSRLDARQDVARAQQQRQSARNMMLEKAAHKPRSRKYMELLKAIDSGGHTTNQAEIQKLMQGLADELGELNMELTSVLLGIVAPCYLGDSYEVHTLNYARGIVRHFKKGEPLEHELEKARNLAAKGNYDSIEVYSGFCCAIDRNGTSSIIKI